MLDLMELSTEFFSLPHQKGVPPNDQLYSDSIFQRACSFFFFIVFLCFHIKQNIKQ